MKEILSRILVIISAIMLLFTIIFVVAKYEASKLAETWNNGYCECGGHWRYEQAVGHQYKPLISINVMNVVIA